MFSTQRLALAGILLPMTFGMAQAGMIERACMNSDRGAANRNLCGCIQQVADQTLANGDQRKAAKFFRDPELANQVWVSQRASDDAFWDRYKAFGAVAAASCG